MIFVNHLEIYEKSFRNVTNIRKLTLLEISFREICKSILRYMWMVYISLNNLIYIWKLIMRYKSCSFTDMCIALVIPIRKIVDISNQFTYVADWLEIHLIQFVTSNKIRVRYILRITESINSTWRISNLALSRDILNWSLISLVSSNIYLINFPITSSDTDISKYILINTRSMGKFNESRFGFP